MGGALRKFWSQPLVDGHDQHFRNRPLHDAGVSRGADVVSEILRINTVAPSIYARSYSTESSIARRMRFVDTGCAVPRVWAK
jgi:hypothetical protein